MTDCEFSRANFALMIYGELGFDEEERIESHVEACAECRAALEQQRALHTAMDVAEIAPPPSLLRQCRENLLSRVADERPAPRPGWWDRLVDAITLRPQAGFLRPIGALSLVAVGFFAARMMPAIDSTWIPMGIGGMVPGHVRYVEGQPGGRVKIVVDETHQRIVSGRVDDRAIRALLLAAMKDPADPALRAETLDLLDARAQSADVRGAMVDTLEHDPNDGVRLKALSDLKPFAGDPDVKGALRFVLLNDPNRGLQTEAMDLLVGSDHPVLDREMVGTLQELMEREQVPYVRQRAVTLLRQVNASVEMY